MIECPPFEIDTWIYYAMLHIIYIVTTMMGIFMVPAMIFKCPKRVKSIKYYFIASQFVGNLCIFMPTEGLFSYLRIVK